MGAAPAEALSASSLKNPDAIKFFVDYRAKVAHETAGGLE
jgi:hypothetical protein